MLGLDGLEALPLLRADEPGHGEHLARRLVRLGRVALQVLAAEVLLGPRDERVPVSLQRPLPTVTAVMLRVALVLEAFREELAQVLDLLVHRRRQDPVLELRSVFLRHHLLEGVHDAGRDVHRSVDRVEQVVVALLEVPVATVLELHLDSIVHHVLQDSESPTLSLRVAEEGWHGRVRILGLDVVGDGLLRVRLFGRGSGQGVSWVKGSWVEVRSAD